MRKVFFVLLFLLTAGTQADTVIRIGLDGVVLAAKQRGNLFQMLGYHLQLASHLNYHYPDENLKKNIQEYEAVLDDLEREFQDADIQKILMHSREIWGVLKADFLKERKEKPSGDKLEKMLTQTASLSDDMKKVQILFMEKEYDPSLIAEVSAAADILESSAKLATYYIIKVSIDPSLVTKKQESQCMKQYLDAMTLLEKSDLAQAKVFQKRLAGIRKVYFFNTMVNSTSKTPIPSLVIKKNYRAYLDTFINVKLITAASTEGKEQTMKML